MATDGLDLADAEIFDWEAALVLPGYPGDDRRPRYRAIGQLREDLVTLVFSPLGAEAGRRHQPAPRKSSRKTTA